MGYTEKVKDGVVTRTYSDGRTETRPLYSSSSSSSRSTSPSSSSSSSSSPPSGSGSKSTRQPLTQEQIELENKRIQEEIKKYGYYTPLQTDEAGNVYQTAPHLSPSKYLQPPDSEEGKRIIRSHPAGEKAYEPSANWVTPSQAEREIQAKIESGEYKVRYIGYKREIGVQGAGGVAWYPDEVVKSKTITKSSGELTGVGVHSKAPELRVASILRDLEAEGFGKTAEARNKEGELIGFDFVFSRTGMQANTQFILSTISTVAPTVWDVKMEGGAITFRGKPSEPTYIYEKSGVDKVITDNTPSELKRLGMGDGGFKVVPSTNSPVSWDIFKYEKGAFGVYPLPGTPGSVDKGFSSVFQPGTSGSKTGDLTSVWLTPIDKAIEEVPFLGGLKRVGEDIASNLQREYAKAGGGTPFGQKGGDWFPTQSGAILTPAGDLDVVATAKREALFILSAKPFQQVATSFLSTPELVAKSVPRAGAALWLGTKTYINDYAAGMGAVGPVSRGSFGMNKYDYDFINLSRDMAASVGASAAGFASLAVSDPGEAAWVGGGFLLMEAAPSLLGANLWGGVIEGSGRIGGELYRSAAAPKQVGFVQYESGNRFYTETVYRGRFGQKIGYSSGQQMQVGEETFYGAYGRVQGQSGYSIAVGQGRAGASTTILPRPAEITPWGIHPGGPRIIGGVDFTGRSATPLYSKSFGFSLVEGKAAFRLNDIPLLEQTAKGVAYSPQGAEMIVLGQGTPYSSVFTGLASKTKGVEAVFAKELVALDPRVTGIAVKESYVVGGKMIVGGVQGVKPLTLDVGGLVVQVEKAARTTAPSSGLGIVGPSTGGFISGGSRAGAEVIQKTISAPVLRLSGDVATKVLTTQAKFTSAGVALADVTRVGTSVLEAGKMASGVVGVSLQKTIVLPETSTLPKMATSPIVSTSKIETLVLTPKLDFAPYQIPATGPKKGVGGISGQMPRTGTVELVGELPRVGTDTPQITELVPVTEIINPNPHTPKPNIPRGGGKPGGDETFRGISLPGGSLNLMGRSGPVQFNIQPRGYQASLIGILFDKQISGKKAPSKLLTGAEVRPVFIQKLPKTKKKKAGWFL